MKKDELLSISPLDGRYSKYCKEIANSFSEFGLIKKRLEIEISWFIFISDIKRVSELPKLSSKNRTFLKNILSDFNLTEAKKIKKIEDTTKHDVKAVEYYLKSKIEGNSQLKIYKEFLHIFCTSEDINNLAYALMIREGVNILSIELGKITKLLKQYSKKYSNDSMLAFTHGQPASPTTMGKELRIYYQRINEISKMMIDIPIMGKINGATGNYSSHKLAYPTINWPSETKKFIESLGLNQNTHTTQIESHDYIANISNKLSHINSVLIGLSQDMWSYISKNYFIQKNVKGEVGSSTMPHKINPINFENAEGNLGLANSLLNYFSSKLVISRLQRDLSDSTTLRNIGAAFGYSIVAYKNILVGLDKISINKEQLSSELDESWEILAEPIQMIARKYSNKDPYELLKKFSRGKKLNREIIINIINSLDIPKKEKNILLNLKPSDYLGYSISLSNE